MIATRVICDVCGMEAPGPDTTIVGGKVHVCGACNKGDVNELLRAVVAAWPQITCRCSAGAGQAMFIHSRGM